MAKITEANVHISVRLDNSADDQCGYDEGFTITFNDEYERADVLPALVHFIGQFKHEALKTGHVVRMAKDARLDG